MSVEENKARMLHAHEAWAGNEAAMEEFLDPETKAGIREILRVMPDYKFTVEDVIAEGDKVVLRWKITGTNQGPLVNPILGPMPPHDKPFTCTGVTIDRFVDGKTVESWSENNWLAQLIKLGVNPMPKVD